MNISLVEGQCLGGKLSDTVNVAIQIDGTQVHERYATKQNDFDEKKIHIDDDIQMSEFALQKNVPLGPAELDLLATVGPRTIHVYDKLCVVVLSTDSGGIRDIAHIVSADIQYSLRLFGARRCEGLLCLSSKADVDLLFFNIKQDGYDQQVDRLLLSFSKEI
ncbi:unnamed protein product [Rotaria socialis]|uniref:Uncharacterized protein n=2 Tax=Rotaria socialis TaxID=392032 RepID=A0A818BV21_9BILA|nr:unnamed protein product [Rotaria socialis]